MKNQLLVITSYPNRGSVHSQQTVGVASYTKSLLEALHQTNQNLKITVNAEVLDKTGTYTESGIKVHRNWRRNQLASIRRLVAQVIKHPAQTVLVSFEAYMFGSPLHTLAFLAGLLTAKAQGKKIVFLLHQVPQSFHGLETSPVKRACLTLAKNVLMRAISLASTKVVVFETKLQQHFPNQDQVEVISHLIPQVKRLPKAVARRKLGWDQRTRYALYFGYLAPYKGVDWLVKNWPSTSDTKLVVAGGINPNHVHNTTIQQFVSEVKLAAERKKITVTGFVPENDLPLYFSACDVVILPYQNFMSSSGPLSLAAAYQQPILLSEPLSDYAYSSDFATALKTANITIKDVSFRFSSQSLLAGLKRTQKTEQKYKLFSAKLAMLRKPSIVASKLAKVV